MFKKQKKFLPTNGQKRSRKSKLEIKKKGISLEKLHKGLKRKKNIFVNFESYNKIKKFRFPLKL